MDRRTFSAKLASSLLLQALPFRADTPTSELLDIRSIPADLVVPAMESTRPGPGKRVRCVLPKYAGTQVHHALYLPTDWHQRRRFPVIVEYPGNGPYTSPFGDFSNGDVDDCALGYGASGGTGYLWLTLPFINETHTGNQLWWWGDVDATLDYCRRALEVTCKDFGGDPSSVLLCGFSRGAIACNYIGLHNDRMAKLWAGFFTSSHYDGVRRWDWPGSDIAAAHERLQRLKGKPTFIAQEISTSDIEAYLSNSGISAPRVFQPLPFHNHTDTWVLRDIPARAALRRWMKSIGMDTLMGPH
jgi:hypothetical protein